MKKVKIVSLLIFIFTLLLIFTSIYITSQNSLEIKILDKINQQKALTQEMSKNIFYIYKKELLNNHELDNSINSFLANHKDKMDEIYFNSTKNQQEKIIKQWNEFYLLVENFRKFNKVITPYSSILLEKLVNDIYTLSLNLIVELDTLSQLHKKSFQDRLNTLKVLQYTLFFILLSLFTYLVAQLKIIISFIHKFIDTSKSILKNSTIKGLEPIEIESSNDEILEASNNFNYMVEKIDNSLQKSTTSIKHTFSALEELENNIENMLELLYSMKENDTIDKELTKKEDAVIETLEELISSRRHLNNLKNDLNLLITHSKLKKSD